MTEERVEAEEQPEVSIKWKLLALLKKLTVRKAVVTRHSWYQVDQKSLVGGAIVAEAGTNFYDGRTVR